LLFTTHISSINVNMYYYYIKYLSSLVIVFYVKIDFVLSFF